MGLGLLVCLFLPFFFFCYPTAANIVLQIDRYFKTHVHTEYYFNTHSPRGATSSSTRETFDARDVIILLCIRSLKEEENASITKRAQRRAGDGGACTDSTKNMWLPY